MRVHYPPIGIAHITAEVCDLFTDRMNSANEVQIAAVFQPKSSPHFGSMVVLFCCFCLAAKIHERFKLRTSVLVDVLENSPATEISVNGVNYTVCLSHHHSDGKNSAELNIRPIVEIAEWASSIASIEFRLRTYREIQAQSCFRDGLIEMLRRKTSFASIVSPSEGVLRIRPVCAECGLVDKEARTVMYDSDDSPKTVCFDCPNHGKVYAAFSDLASVIDTNAPIRTVLRSLCFHKEKATNGRATIIVNGGDWAGAWMQRVYFDGLSLFGCCGTDVPFNLFVPQILDESGAKLSKTIYLEEDAYSNIDTHWLTVPAFRAAFGEAGYRLLWDEIENWMNSPTRFFRNYSVKYFAELFSKNVSQGG